MAAGKSSQSNAMLYTVITFVGLFLAAAVCAVVFYVKYEDQRTLTDKAVTKAESLANEAEYRNISKTVGKVERGTSYLTAMQDYLDMMVSAVTGEVVDGNASVKVKAAVDAINETMVALGEEASPTYGVDGIDLLGTLLSFRDKVVAAQQSVMAMQQTLKNAQDEFDVKMDAANETQAQLNAEKENFQAEAERIQASYNELKTGMEESAAGQVQIWQDKFAAEEKKRREKEIELATALDNLAETTTQLQEAIATLEEIKPRPDIEVAAFLPDAKVISVDLDTGVIYLNLGTKDHVYRGLTFSIFDDNAPIPEDGKGKAEVEVFQIEENVTAARIVTSNKKNPIVADNIAVNLVWDKKTSNSFVVAGDFDFDGDGRVDRDGRDKIVQLIEQWGGRIVEDLTIDTDFVVLGVEPVSPPEPSSEDFAIDPRVEEKYQEAQDRIDRYYMISDKAEVLSVPKFSAKRFLMLIGYESLAGKSTPTR